ncbi:MAG: hypothetical protein A2176_02395 [Spirochaetes bacterium RBG_13_51_14]|nr:MAG: hypothetical protein A2176_02395 [Spirochaetes bacterium RBG_13_51_14]
MRFIRKAITILSIIPVILCISTTRSLGTPTEKVVVASFSTSIADQEDAVKRNILIASRKINGSVIAAHDNFSFNDTVGEGSAENGYAPGRVLYRDRVAMEPGGGLCQASSTLFNAFLMAGCLIIERHRHFQPVSYVPLGLDATIKYGKKDLRIKNPYSYNLMVESRMSDSSLMIVITADQKPPYRYEIYTEEEEVPVPVAEDADRIRQGISVLVYRRRYQGEKLIDSMLLHRDYYPPVYLR